MAAPREPSVSGTRCRGRTAPSTNPPHWTNWHLAPLPPLRGFFLLSNIALIAVPCRTGSAESTPRRAFLEPKNLMTSWPIKLSQATVKAIAKAKPNSRAAPTIKNLPALGTEEAGLGLKLERGVGTPRYLTGRTCTDAPFGGPFFMPSPRRANEGPATGKCGWGKSFLKPNF